MARRYELKRRAERQEETRRRVVEAAVELHQTLGIAKTTITAIAERAGVERLTVYRHFPDERALLTACTRHYWAAHRWPDPTTWECIEDPETRLRTALGEIYSYHRRTEAMSTTAVRDLPDMSIAPEILAPYFEHWARIQDVLARRWDQDGQQRTLVLAAIGHAISFLTWRSLAREQGLEEAQAIELMVGMVVRSVAQNAEGQS